MSDHTVQSTTHNHLLPFNENWFVWKDFSLRGAGFDANLIARLAAEESPALAREIFEQRKIYRQSHQKIRRALDDFLADASDTERKAAFKFKEKLRKNKITDSSWLPVHIRELLSALELLQATIAEKKAKFNEVFNRERKEIGVRLWEIGQSPELREAIMWQNRQAFRDFVKPWLDTPPDPEISNRWKKRRELLLTSYLQRYTTKNDSIGFFGPVAWGIISETDDKIAVGEGDEFLAYRNVFTEGWAIDALASAFSADSEVTRWLNPRRFSYIRLVGDKLFVGDEKPQTLPPKFVAVLARCDGRRNVSEIIEQILADKSGGINSEKEVLNILTMLEKRQIVAWHLEIPWIADFPRQLTFEQRFAEAIGALKNEGIKKRLENEFGLYLDALEETRKAAGNVEKLDQALARLDELFVELTGRAAQRGAGKTYAGRTIVFEDCRRAVSITLGKKILDEIAAPLDLLFTSVRWLTNRTIEVYKEGLLTVHDEILCRTEGEKVEFFDFWKQANALFFHETASLAKKIVPEFQEKWRKILNVPKDEKAVVYDSATLADEVRKEFFAELPGWSIAKYNSPDVMIAARDLEHINGGDFQYVIGELHIGVNTLMNSMFVRVHENPAEIMEYYFADFPRPRFIIAPPKEMVTSRNYPLLNAAKDFYLGFTKDAVNLGKGNYLEISDLIVEKIDGELFIATRDGKNKFPTQVVFADILSGICTNLFKIVEPADHTPRITFDKLVVQRETWRFPFSALDFAFAGEESEAFLAAQSWRLEFNVPRRVFLKLSGETKPFFLDFDSPVLIENVCKNIRNLAEQASGEGIAVFSEMLPDFENLWFSNKKGERFTSEFRLVFVDKKGLSL